MFMKNKGQERSYVSKKKLERELWMAVVSEFVSEKDSWVVLIDPMRANEEAESLLSLVSSHSWLMGQRKPINTLCEHWFVRGSESLRQKAGLRMHLFPGQRNYSERSPRGTFQRGQK